MTGPTDIQEPTLELARRLTASGPDPEGGFVRLLAILTADPTLVADAGRMEHAAAIASASRSLGATLSVHPRLLRGTSRDDSVPLRFRSALISVLGDELAGRIDMRTATEKLSASMNELVEDTLVAARAGISERFPLAVELPFSVIAMGKWGAGELNYYSDLDLMFVHSPIVGKENDSRSTAIALASRVMSTLSAPTFDGHALVVDADLRPEGTMGPLSRSLDSYRAYYERWAEAWELQALIKARHAAGDAQLGAEFRDLADEVVWEPGMDSESLRSIRLLKARAEESAPARDIKRSRGGIRDIEFTVQIVQLVHGRFDEDLRVAGTLDAIEALGEHGYVTPDESTRLGSAYSFLRDVEHRLQIWDLIQTQTLPDRAEDKERLGRSLGLGGDPGAKLDAKLAAVRREVRDLHERLYFQPILDALVGSSTARLGPEQATVRLEALGFKDAGAAADTFKELTGGLSRRSRVMHQVLPLMLDWLSQSPDPDLGLAQMRLLLAHTTDHSALVSILQGNPMAGERLCLLLGTGKLLGDLIDRVPEFIPRLGDDDLIWDIRDRDGAEQRLIGLLDSRPEHDAKVGTIRRFVRRRKLRIAARDVLGEASTEMTLESLSDSADAAVAGALHLLGDDAGAGFGIIAMGKWGGKELSYGSDVDLMYVYADETARDSALKTSTDLARILSEPNRHGEAYELDAGLRPEGRKGPLARSLEGFRRYYSEWAEPWEMLALVKARPAVGDSVTLTAFADLTGQVVWKPSLPEPLVREIRAIKARVEAERIPAGEDPDFHLKLGPGGLADVEFLTQLLQLRHGGALPDLRVTGTIPALIALNRHGILSNEDYGTLQDSYLFCTRARLRLHLQQGRVTDSLPTDPDLLAHLAGSLGFDRSSELREQYRRHTRRARRVFEALFYQ